MVYYSAQLFGDKDGTGPSPAQASLMINTGNFFGAFIGILLLSRFGRRTIMAFTLVFESLSMIGLYFATSVYPSETLQIVLVLAFVVAF